MPQMAPMYWLFLFFYFLAIFLVYIMLTYYFVLPTGSVGDNIGSKSFNSFSWSW